MTKSEIFKCVDCGAAYSLTDREKGFYLSRGLALPKRCKACREAKREKRKLDAALAASPFEQTTLEQIASVSPTQTLFIIGNGFDLMHGVPSSYYNFRDSLGKHSALRETLETNLTPTDLWADFEDSLAHINIVGGSLT